MQRIPAILLCGGLILALGGCNRDSGVPAEADTQSTAKKGAPLAGVAVIDLDEVARRVGSDAVMVQSLREGEASLSQQLQSIQTTLQTQYQQKRREFEAAWAAGQQDKATGEKQLETIGQQLDLKLNEAWREANNQLNAHRQQLILSFREEVKPVALEAAAKRGLGVVVTKNETVLLAFDQRRDITDDVVEMLLTRRAAAKNGAAATVASRLSSATTSKR